MTDWVPATEAEVAMRDALRDDDQELYFRILSRVELLLPVSSEAIAGRAPMGWGTWTAGGRTHVLAFTSSEAMRACLAEHAGSARRMPYYELAAAWPNLDWWLAVNPGLPIEGYLPAWFISQLARGDARLPGQVAQGRAALPRREPAALPRREESALPRRDESGTHQRAESTLPRREPAVAPSPQGSAPSQPEGSAPSQPEGFGLPQRGPSGLPRRQPSSTLPQWEETLGRFRGSAPLPTRTTVAPASESPPALPRRVPAQSTSGVAAVPEPGPTRSEAARPEPARPEPQLEPANELESQLLSAVRAGRMDHFLSTLLLSKVLLPVAEGADPQLRPGQPGFVWRTGTLADQGDQLYVTVFSSTQRLAEHFGGEKPAIDIRFVQLIRAWPDQSWALSVNPGSPISMALPSSQIARLASSVEEVGLGDDAGAASESGASRAPARSTTDQPVAMQKVIAPSQVSWYLERNYDRVCGFVHREQEVAHLRTPEKLVAGLGLRYEGSPFAPDANEIYVLRWPAYRPALYRIPYGGRTEAAMAAMEGWVIERPPFRGNGFAPAETDDVIAEFKVDSVRLPHGAQLWRLSASGQSQLVAILDADGPTWRTVEEKSDA